MASITQPMIEAAMQLRKAGANYPTIAKAVGVSETTARGICAGKRKATCDDEGRVLPHVYANTKNNRRKKTNGPEKNIY
jgi:predicted transcriptional regulator